MQILNAPGELRGAPCPVSVAIGVFDGVHLGHQQVIRRMREAAKAEGAKAVVLTFDPHPTAILAPERTPLALQPLPQRLRILADMGVEAAWAIPFTKAFSRQTGEEFIRFLAEEFGELRSVHVGSRFTFGHQRSGDISLLRALGNELGFKIDPVEAVVRGGAIVSSTRLRKLVSQGDLRQVKSLLGRTYSLAGIVEKGEQLGRRLSAPTANISVEGLALPPYGVYAVKVSVDGHTYPGVANLGVRPTIADASSKPRLETHLLDTDLSLYGRRIEVHFEHFLRPEKRFADVEELTEQIRKDVAKAREVLAEGA